MTECTGLDSDLPAALLQPPLQLLQVGVHLPQEQLQPVPDDVHLLLGLQPLHGARGRGRGAPRGRGPRGLDVDQQLGRQLLQGRDLLLGVQQLLLDWLVEGERRGGVIMLSSYVIMFRYVPLLRYVIMYVVTLPCHVTM